MRKTLTVFTVIILCYSAILTGQEGVPGKYEVGISVFSAEINGETLNHGLEPKFIIGTYFNKSFKNLIWSSSADFGVNNIDDDCSNCEDNYYGIGKLTEFNVASGLRYRLIKNISYPLQPFLEMDLYYSYSQYEGTFGGGISGDGTIRDIVYNSLGFLGKAGISFFPAKSIALTLSCSFKAGYVNASNKLSGSTDTYTGLTTMTPLQIRVGYLF